VSSSAIGSVFESMLGSMLESVLRAYLGAYSLAGWECAIESNWERTVRQAGSVQLSAIRSLLQSVLGSVQ
jgi:hypothetical protein